jgi:hypothetical protein
LPKFAIRSGQKQQFAKHIVIFAVKIRPGGPLRIVAWPTWSGRERSSHSHFLQVPQTRLASYLFNSAVQALSSKKKRHTDVTLFRNNNSQVYAISTIAFVLNLDKRCRVINMCSHLKRTDFLGIPYSWDRFGNHFKAKLSIK